MIQTQIILAHLIIFAHFNIKSTLNKLDQLPHVIKGSLLC